MQGVGFRMVVELVKVEHPEVVALVFYVQIPI